MVNFEAELVETGIAWNVEDLNWHLVEHLFQTEWGDVALSQLDVGNSFYFAESLGKRRRNPIVYL